MNKSISMPSKELAVQLNRVRQTILESGQKAYVEGLRGSASAYFISQLQFETGDKRYQWLNNTMAVGEGKLKPNEVTYRVYAVVPD